MSAAVNHPIGKSLQRLLEAVANPVESRLLEELGVLLRFED